MTPNEAFEQHLKAKKLSKVEAARRCDVHRNAVHAWCKGTTPPPRQARVIWEKLAFRTPEWPVEEGGISLHIDFGKAAWKLDAITAHARRRDMDLDDLVYECVADNIEAFEGSPSEAAPEFCQRDGTYRIGPRCGMSGSRAWEDTEFLLVAKLDLETLDALEELSLLSGRMSPSEWVRRIIQEEIAAPDYLKRAYRRGQRKQLGYNAVEPMSPKDAAIVERALSNTPVAPQARCVDDPTEDVEVDYE